MKAFQHAFRQILEVDGEPTRENEPVEVVWDELLESTIPEEVPMFQERCFDNEGRAL